jgi:predicted nucleic acid-binding protein
VLDANILVRAVLGSRVLFLIRKYVHQVEFLTPDIAFNDAHRHLPSILERRNIPIAPAISIWNALPELIQSVECDTYGRFENISRDRMKSRDEEDWPILATALAFGCPIWTEDSDFFGCGVATWTTDRVEFYLDAQE